MPSAFKVPLATLLAAAMLPVIVSALEPAPRAPEEDDRCPVCGMNVSPFPTWIAEILFDDGSAAFFDGSKDLFKFLADQDRYEGDRQARAITAVYVTDYYNLELIAAESAFFVLGSDVYGPMGLELIPLADQSSAEEFLRDHKGQRILRFADIDSEVLEALH